MSYQELILNPRTPKEGCAYCGGKVSVYCDNADNYLYQCLEVNCRTQENMVQGVLHTDRLGVDAFTELISGVVEELVEEEGGC